MGLFLFAVIYLVGSWRLPRFSLGIAVVDAHIFPLVLGSILLLLSILYYLQSAGKPAGKALLVGVDKPLLAKLIGASVLYALVLSTLGYIVATTLFLLGAMHLLGRRNWRSLAAIAAGFSVITYSLFAYVLGVPLARGILPF
jgi:putative tricarboxylic transport membrane protein